MAERMCQCGANPATEAAGRCLPCHRDHVAAEDQRAAEAEARRLDTAADRRRGRPAYRPDRNVGHGLGRGRHCGQYGRSGP
jgi:hypothetical protein